MRYVIVDVETLGLVENCPILEVGAVVDDVNWWTKPVEKLPTFHYFVEPQFNLFPAQMGAINMHVKSGLISRWNENERQPTQNIANLMYNWLLNEGGYECNEEGQIKITMAGKNPNFDLKFLHNQIQDFTKRIKVRHRMLDPAILFSRAKDESLPDLSTCMERAKFPRDEVPHSALKDAQITDKLIRIGLREIWKAPHV